MNTMTPRERMLAERLRNYKISQAARAEKLGLSLRLAYCKTLTEARKLLRGELK